MFNIALIYDNGFGIKLIKQEHYIIRICFRTIKQVCFIQLGWMYYNGENVNKDVFKAFELYKMSQILVIQELCII